MFYIKLSYWELPFAGSCIACVCIKLLGNYHLQGLAFACVLHQAKLLGTIICRVLFCLCFASSYWGSTICRVLFCLCLHQAKLLGTGSCFAFVLHQAPFARSCFACRLLGNYHLQGLVLLVFCIKLLGNYHLQGLVLLVFYIKLSYWELPFAGSCFACVLHQAIGEVPFAGSCFACVLHQAKLLGTTICRVLFCLRFASS